MPPTSSKFRWNDENASHLTSHIHRNRHTHIWGYHKTASAQLGQVAP